MKKMQSGFTLIELSIVLVIIGLIVGGILVGQDLIKGAEIRAAISKIEKFDAASNTFRNKYGGLPGDIQNPADFGFDSAGVTPDGNGRINRTGNDSEAEIFNGEAAIFFRHLYQTNLINNNIESAVSFASPFDALSMNEVVPFTSVGANIATATLSGNNYYYMFRGASAAGDTINFSTSGELRVIDVYQIDSKVDDGIADSGRAVAVTNFTTDDVSGDCHSSGTYATDASANEATCMLRIRTSF